jgi:hypothetical protein
MSRYTIVPAQNSDIVNLIASDIDSVMHVIDRRAYPAADVYLDGLYIFSVCRAKQGFWTIFEREAKDLEVGVLG